MATNQQFCFTDLAESKEFAEFYGSFWNLFRIPIALTDDNKKLVKRFCPENEMHPVCRVIRNSSKGYLKCMETDVFQCNRAVYEKHGIFYNCHAGLVDIAIPVFIEGEHIATINGGQILTESPNEKGFRELWNRVKHLSVEKNALREAYFNSPCMTDQQLQSLFRLLSFFADYFCEIGRRLKTIEMNEKYPGVIDVKEYIKEKFREPISLSDAAEYAGLSVSYLSRLFKKAEGVNFTHYLQNIRLGNAKKLLAKTNLSITQIAYDSGFSNLSYFNELFQKVEKCTPTEFRKQHQRSS